MQTFKQFIDEATQAKKPRPTAAYIKSLGMQGVYWGSLKRHLVDIKVINTVDDDAPKEWQEAFTKAHGRKLQK